MAGTRALIISMTFSSVAFLFVSLRYFSRIFFVGHLFAEDILILIALVCSFGVAGTIEAERQYGLGKDFNTLSPDQTVPLFKALWASILIYNLGLAFVKCSICCQYLRFSNERNYMVAVQCILGFLIVYGIATVFLIVFTCTPVQYFWDKSIPGGKCVNYVAWWFFNASVCILTDFVLCILPIPMLKTLNLPRRQKYGLIGVFAVGGFACIVAILRLHAISEYSNSSNHSKYNVDAASWSAIEVNTGIICACMPTIRPLVAMIYRKLFGASKRSVLENSAFKECSSKHAPSSSLAPTTPLEDVSFCTVPEGVKEYFEESGDNSTIEDSRQSFRASGQEV